MTDASRRLVGASCFLAALWVLVYWLWQPARPGVSFARADNAEPALTPDPGSADAPAIQERAQTPAVRDPLDPSGPQAAPPAAPLSPGPSLLDPTPSVPVFRDYTIREGDTFESIAARELGSRALHEAIARANPLKDPRRLRVGEVIRLPLDPQNVQGPGAAPGSPVQEAVAQGPVTYTVEPGDSLSKISQLFYGTVRHADLIFRANRDVLRSVDDVRAGQVIRIPPRPE